MQLVPRGDGINTIKQILRRARLALLTTEDANGELHSRPMQTLDIDFDGEVWFFANKYSVKVSEILLHPRVNVSYLYGNCYVSLAGTATIVADVDRKRELWMDSLFARFKDGPESPDAVLIRVAVESGQYWDELDGPLDRVVSVAKMFVLHDKADAGPQGSLLY